MDSRLGVNYLRKSITRPCLSTSIKTRPVRTNLSLRTFSERITPIQHTKLEAEADESTSDTARWKQTPKAFNMPFRVALNRRDISEWKVNEDPVKLNKMYDKLIGGHELLTEETRWLAVTHKSFDQGRRGYNSRLAYLGRRILEMHVSMALATLPPPSITPSDEFGRDPVVLPEMKGLSNLTETTKTHILSQRELFSIAKSNNIHHLIRWIPADFDLPMKAGFSLVTVQALYAIIGALALEKGGRHASRFIKEKILNQRLNTLT